MISIIIVTWHSEEFIKQCLLSIISQFDFSSCEIIVIDNNSQDTTVSIIEQEFSQVILIKNSNNYGYAQANNQGLRIAKGKYVLLLNPDTQLQNNFFIPMLEFIEKNPTIAAVAPKILNPDLTTQPSIRSFPNLLMLLWEFSGLARILPKHKIIGKWRMEFFSYNELSEVEQPMTSCLLVRKSAIDDIGHFDLRFPMFYNDVDLCYRLKQAGGKIYYFPKSSVIHERGASTKRVRTKMIFSMHKSLYHYFEKYDSIRSFRIKKLFLCPIFIFTAIIRASWGLFLSN